MIRVRVLRDGRQMEDADLAELAALRQDPRALIWVEAASPTAEDLAVLGREFGVHEVALEDLDVGERQRPKKELIVEDYQELLTGTLDANATMVSNRVNTVAGNLAAYAAIFAVITMISGIYGMNFRHMPELGWRYGYAWALGLMVVGAGGLWVYFKRKGWL